ncbi:MAG: glycosyltransferase family 39 protein [Patescibacteria group bacterium]|nr:glycosyltransferase family 39 protein [Patescibacteria group bacterium]MCL5095197.1 glycosyltransferase family 39 protein [Patescibacteria group bacterium]
MAIFKDLRKIEIFAVFVIFVAYFFSRFLSLNNFPIFTDEAIYLRWAQIAKNDANWRFISLTDGKQPLFIWLTMMAMRVISDPITAGRFISVLAGAGSILGLIFGGKLIFQKWQVGIIAGFLYLISPFAMVYDRMALMDGLLAMLMLWALILEILLMKNLRLDIALLLGGLMGFTMLTKTSGFISLYLLPFSLLLFDFSCKERLKRLSKWLCLVLISCFVSQMIYSVLRLSPFFHMVSQKDTTFIYPLSEWLNHPFTFFYGNLAGLWSWIIGYLSWPLVVTVFLSFLAMKFFREKLLLFSWFMVPFVGLALFGKVIYPRFIFFMTLPLFLLSAKTLFNLGTLLKKKIVTIFLLVILFIVPLKTDYELFVNPTEAPIPRSDSHQYFNDWPSGWGIKESVDLFKEKARQEKIAVFTEGTFGLLPAAIELYLVDDTNVFIKGIWPIPDKPTAEVMEKAKTEPTYIIFFQNQPPPGWLAELILKTKKGTTDRYNYVYQIKP